MWIGNGTTAAEKHNAMPYAHVIFNLSIYNISYTLHNAGFAVENYLMKSTHPLVPVTCLGQGKCKEKLM